MNNNVVVPGEIKSLADIEAIEAIPLSENGVSNSQVEREINRLLGAYSFRAEVTVQ